MKIKTSSHYGESCVSSRKSFCEGLRACRHQCESRQELTCTDFADLRHFRTPQTPYIAPMSLFMEIGIVFIL